MSLNFRGILFSYNDCVETSTTLSGLNTRRSFIQGRKYTMKKQSDTIKTSATIVKAMNSLVEAGDAASLDNLLHNLISKEIDSLDKGTYKQYVKAFEKQSVK